MHLKISKLLILSLFAGSLYGNEILSQERLDALNLSEKKIKQESKKLKIDWINPITYTYTHSDNEMSGLTRQSTIAISQPIFKSGGIYSAIKYANNIKASSLLSLDLQKKALVTKTLNIAYNIKKLELQIKKQKLSLENAQIDYKTKKESVFNGLLDISFLNNAIITKNNIQSALLDLKYQKESLLLSFNNLSSKDINTITLPVLKQVTLDTYNKNNLDIKQSQLEIKTKKNLNWMTTARYLPTVNINYSKTKYHETSSAGLNDGDTNDQYGFNVVIPINFKGYYDTQASKIIYLQAKKDLEILKIEEKNFFYQKELKLKTVDEKIALTKENITSYNELVSQTIELKNVGLKTSDDVQVLKNSKKSEELNLDIYAIDKQIELLEIYGKLAYDKI
jgi:outer membrane protein TolC